MGVMVITIMEEEEEGAEEGCWMPQGEAGAPKRQGQDQGAREPVAGGDDAWG